MDVVSVLPELLAGVGAVGLSVTWWWVRRHQSNVLGGRSGTERLDNGRPDVMSRSKLRKKSIHKPRSKPLSDEQLDTLMGWAPMSTRVLTTAEREAYHVLRKALPDHMVLAQVPVARFIKVPTRNSYSEWLRRVGSLCADLVVCDANSQAVAVVEIRQPLSRENERAQRRHARMDRVLEGARIPVHVWLEGALPGAVVAREAILGAVLQGLDRIGPADNQLVRRDAEAAAVVASMQGAGELRGLSVDEHAIDVVLVDSGSMPLDARRPERV
jgi:hypothetical protein